MVSPSVLGFKRKVFKLRNIIQCYVNVTRFLSSMKSNLQSQVPIHKPIWCQFPSSIHLSSRPFRALIPINGTSLYILINASCIFKVIPKYKNCI